MRRPALLLLPLALAGPVALAAPQAASAATPPTTQSSSCTDAGGHLWNATAVWGGTYTESGGTVRRVVDAVAFTSPAPDATTVDYSVTTVDGAGQVVRTISAADLAFDFAAGTRSRTVDPRNPPTSPGKAKVVLTVGDGDDGKADCTVTFAEPGGTSAVDPGAGAPCVAGKEVVTFSGGGSSGLGQYGQGNYDASTELWNVGGYSYAQKMGVCTHDAWWVDVTTDNSRGDGAVKAYPSMRRIYHDWSTTDFSRDPLVSSFPRLEVDFAATDPASCSGCIYDTAFDIWLNGIGNGSAHEVMIWTHNVNQRPYGTKVASGLTIAGHTWDLWSGNSNHYLAFVPTDTSHIPSGTFDVKAFTGALVAQSRIPSASRLGQISYGVETVSTGAVKRHWDFTRFTVRDS